MVDSELLYTLGLMVVCAAVGLLLARRLSIPSIIVYLAVGLLLGPATGLLDLGEAAGHGVGDPGPIDVIANVGIALLLFLVGLELSLDRVRDVGRVAVVAGLGQVVFTGAIGFALALALQFDAMSAFFIATALTFSSTVVVVKLLTQRGDIQALYGRIAIGIFLVQDLVVIVALTFLAGLSGAADDAAAPSMAADLGLAFLGMVALLLGALFAARYLLPLPFAWAARSPETLFIWSLCWCFALVLLAETLHLSPEIGAFLAGMSLAQLPVAHALHRRVQPLMNFFIAVFFVALGARMNLAAAIELWPIALALSAFVLIGNPFIFMLIISRFGYGERTSFQTSVTVAQISEFSFIFATMGVTAGLISAEILSLVALVGIITIATSAYMILYSERLYAIVRNAGLLRPFNAGEDPPDPTPPDQTGHVIVVGMNSMGRRIVTGLAERGVKIVAVDTDPAKLRQLPARRILGDITDDDTAQRAALQGAALVVSALRIEEANNLIAWRCRAHGVPCAIHAFDPSMVPQLRDLGVAHLIDSKGAGVHGLTKRAVQQRQVRP